jgi:hypothetical protein
MILAANAKLEKLQVLRIGSLFHGCHSLARELRDLPATKKKGQEGATALDSKLSYNKYFEDITVIP